jgi:hypothetical protein
MSYREVEGAPPNANIITALTNSLRVNEKPLLGAGSSRFQFGFHDLQMVAILITTERLLVAKNKLFGKPKANFSIELSDVASCGYGPLRGVGPTWEAHFTTLRDSPAIMYFRGPVPAEEFKDRLKAAAIGTAELPPASDGEQSPMSDSDAALFTRLHNLLDALRPLATQEMLGHPFGEGVGLEAAMQALFQNLASPQDCRDCAQVVVVDLIVNTKDDRLFDETLAIMGATEGVATRFQLSDEVKSAVVSIGGAALQLLTEWEGPGSSWELWQTRADVAAEMLCWHSVARLRLATAGRMPEVTRP